MNATPSISTWQSTIIEDWTQARAEILRIHPVEALKVAGIVEPDADAHHVLEAVAGLEADGDEVLHLTEPEKLDVWLRAPWSEAAKLQLPLSDGVLQIVAKGQRKDGDE